MKYLVLLFVMVTFLVFVENEVYGGYVARDLYAYWSFDKSTINGKKVRDIAGNSDGTINGNVKSVPGRYSEALEFDGKEGNYLEITTLEGFGAQLGNFSMDFWFKSETTPDWTTFLKTLTDGLSMALAIDLNRTAKPAWAYVEDNTHFYIRDTSGKALAPEIKAPIYDNKWHHIAWVTDDTASNICIIYVDGEEQEIDYAKVDAPEVFEDFQHPVYVGAANNRGAIERFCPAAVDELRIYLTALTEQEVMQNMSSGASVESFGKLPVLWGELKAIR